MSNFKDKSMVLITVPFLPNQKTFRLIPGSTDCPYIDCIYWYDKRALEIVGVTKKQDYTMLPRLNDNGDVERVGKAPRETTPGEAPKTYKEERKMIEIMQNYYITEKEDIINFVKLMAINADTFNFEQYLSEPAVQASPSIILP